MGTNNGNKGMGITISHGPKKPYRTQSEEQKERQRIHKAIDEKLYEIELQRINKDDWDYDIN